MLITYSVCVCEEEQMMAVYTLLYVTESILSMVWHSSCHALTTTKCCHLAHNELVNVSEKTTFNMAAQ